MSIHIAADRRRRGTTLVGTGIGFASCCPRLVGKCRVTYNDFCHQPCVVCGLTLPPERPPGRVMVAHHRDPHEKKYSPSELSRRADKWWMVLVIELRKCVPLCAVCHAVVHDIAGNSSQPWNATLMQALEDIATWTRND